VVHLEGPLESIFEIPAQNQVKYVSKFRPTVVQESKLTKDAMRTMGPAKVELPSPDKYLKKPSKESRPLEVTECSKDAHKTYTCTEKKPPTATAVPKKPQPMWVDTNTGHKQPLENSGLVPKYIKKKVFSNNTAQIYNTIQ
uniref:Uncharacterized protein n=1 Tax=Amphiprion percula TaxID=161767 RepID=A0A3P8RJD7_AMPPE